MSTVSVSKQKKHRHEQDFIKRSTGEKVFNVVNIVIMLILLCLFLFPVFNVVSISLSDDNWLLRSPSTPSATTRRPIPPSSATPICGGPPSTASMWPSSAVCWA